MIINWSSRNRLIGAVSFVVITSTAPAPVSAGIQEYDIRPSYKLNYSFVTPYVEPPIDLGPGGLIKYGEEEKRKKHYVAPRRIYIKPKLEPSLRLEDIFPEIPEVTEVEIEGEPYQVVVGDEPTPKGALEMLPPHELAEKLAAVREDLKATEGEARKYLEAVAEKEIKEAKEIKKSLFIMDEELALLIIFSEA